jgi:hypothetical protein
MSDPASGKPRMGALPVVGLSLLLLAWCGWRIFTLAMANFQVDTDPVAALAWREDFPEAVLVGEERRLREAKQAIPSEHRLRTALGVEPLKPLGYRVLARNAELRSEPLRARALYGIAAHRGPRDLPSLAWVAQHELEDGEYAAALANIDQMLRVEPEVAERLKQTMMAIAAHPDAQKEMARLLRQKPPWRKEFLTRLISQYPDGSRLFPLMEQLRAGPGGLTVQETGWWIARLAHDGQWGVAYLTWVQSLDPEASVRIGNVYNGGFELPPSQTGFDWQFRDVPGARISRAEAVGAGEKLALRVEFEDRRVPFANVRQLLALAPGDYRFRGRVRLDDLRTERGLVWTLTCANNKTKLGESEAFSGRRDWREFETEFSVPAERCGGQWLTLRLPSRIPAEQRIGGVAWFDDLAIKSH